MAAVPELPSERREGLQPLITRRLGRQGAQGSAIRYGTVSLTGTMTSEARFDEIDAAVAEAVPA